ncbi:MAG: 4Fe-4S binding protein [Deltaproteobacteria bacterium]|nr:4Fe-4S binding protein [Deltaproteobacteria bacterium]
MILSRFRSLTQLACTFLTNSFFGTIATKSVNTNALKRVCVPILNCYACPGALFSCPIGTLQHFMAIRTIPFYWLGLVGLVGITTGRMACGWVCPFGFLQDLMYKIKSPKYRISRLFTYIKYLVLAVLVIIIPYRTGELWFSKLCPAGTLTAAIPWALWNPTNPGTGQPVLPTGPGVIFWVSLLVLAVFLVWFVFSKRPFCRVACPMGAILSLFNRFSMVRLEVEPHCDGCHICEANCPMDLNVSLDFNSKDCIRCLECTRCGHVSLVTPFSSQETK